MKAEKRKKLEAAGFRIGDADDFLELTPEERELVALRLRLSRLVRTLRESQELTQPQLAKRIGSSQSRVAKMESGAAGVSLDLLFKTFFAVGGELSAVVPSAKSDRRRRVSPAKRSRVAAKA